MHIGHIRRERIRCYECKYEWNIRLGSYLESRHIGLSDFIGCLKLYVDGTTASKVAMELEVSPRLTFQLIKQFRNLLIGETNSDVSYEGEVTFAISDTDGNIQINTVPNDSRNSGSLLNCSRSIDKDRAFNFNFEYQNLKRKSVLRRIDNIDSMDRFYLYCQENLYKFRGRDVNVLLETLKELAFRYNHRNEDLFEILLGRLRK